MTVIIPESDSGEGGGNVAEETALMAAGNAGAHAESAAESAAVASESVAVAEQVADAAGAAAEESAVSAAVSRESADAAGAGATAIAEALNAQSTAIQALVEEMRASRSTPATPVVQSPQKKTAPDKAPATKKSFRDRYYGGRR